MTPGTRIGVYEVTAPIGSGGMGEVYRATDTRLNREVALKVLPEALASDPDRVSRFKREAQVLASLNHPNVAHVYGVEGGPDGAAAPGGAAKVAPYTLVMEFVPGEDLAARIARGSLPIDDTVAIARQIAEAIEYAHEQGVIHRDLKPANIKITPGGAVKVLDFGLAKALDQGPGMGSPGSGALDRAMSPTLSLAATQAGLILGTAPYMSPEQAKGKPADRRADIWSFGIVVFEMLSGLSVYSGETVSETMAHVITKEPEWATLPETTPPRLRELLRRCLVKDPRNRLQAIGEARIALQQLAEMPDAIAESTVSPAREPASSSRRREWIWASIGIMGLVAALWMAIRDRFETPPRVDSVRFELVTPPRGGPDWPQGSVSLAPDGRKIAYVALSGSRQLLWVHSFDTGNAQPLDSTEGIGPALLIWSPDSRHLAYSVPGERRLRRVAATGGPSQAIGTLPEVATGSWGATDVILLGGQGGLQRVSATGGEVVPLDVGEGAKGETHRFPSFLPDGRHYFYLALTASGPVAYVGALDSADRRPLPGIVTEVRYASSGHVLFLRDGSLMAQAFDVNRLALSGEPFLVVDRLAPSTAVAGAYSTSANGTLAYRPIVVQPDGQLSWFGRTGKPTGVVGPPGRYNDIELSLDDRFVVFEGSGTSGGTNPSAAIERTGDIWVLDLQSGVTSRTTSDPARDADPVWSPDGKAIAFRGDRDGGHLYQRAFGVVGDDVLVYKGKTRESPDHWSPDGHYLIYSSADNDIWALPMALTQAQGHPEQSRGVTGDQQPIPVASTTFRESDGRVSPDGRWIAYVSNESGRNEVYLQSFPKPGVRRQISSAGGGIPRWSRDGRELFYIAPPDNLMAVAVSTSGDSLSLSAPSPLFRAPDIGFAEGNYAVASSGRFLLNVPLAERVAAPIAVVLNWAAGLRR